jgi:hypothetical protein
VGAFFAELKETFAIEIERLDCLSRRSRNARLARLWLSDWLADLWKFGTVKPDEISECLCFPARKGWLASVRRAARFRALYSSASLR